MKALFLIVCILLASTLFIPTSTIARELVEKEDLIYTRPIKPLPVPKAKPICGRLLPYGRCIPRASPPKEAPGYPPPPAPVPPKVNPVPSCGREISYGCLPKPISPPKNCTKYNRKCHGFAPVP